MNTIERVARGICAQWVNDQYGWSGGVETGYVNENWPNWQDEAQAALNALADGLEWGEGGDHILCFNGLCIGGIVELEGGTSFRSKFFIDVLGHYSTAAEAREALMTAARKWLTGD